MTIKKNYEFKRKEIEEIRFIFDCLSLTRCIDSSYGKKGTYFLWGQSMLSICASLETIDFCLYRDALSDAYTLTRKVRDDLFQYLFILYVIKHKHCMIEQEIERMVFAEAENAVEKWFYNELEQPSNSMSRKKYFDASKYKSFLTDNSDQIRCLFDLFYKDVWKGIDRKLNNYVHGNGLRYIMKNYAMQNNQNDLIAVLQDIVDIFLSCLSIIDSTKLQASDYMDAVEMGIKPADNSKYWVCPVISEYMNKRFSDQLIDYIQDNEGHGMLIIE